MKKLITPLAILALIQTANAQNIGINSTGANPAASAMLDVVATDKGLLVPRVALTATNAAGPIALPATSLFVYNTATAGAGVTAVTPGYYYNAGTTAVPNWKKVSTDGDHWKTVGNLGTTASNSGYGGTAANNNFIGTTDAEDFVIATNGFEKLRIKSDGTTMARIGIGTAFTSNLNTGSTSSLIHLHDWGTTVNDYPVMQLSTANTASGRTVGILNFASTGTANEKRVATIESYLTAASGTNASGDLRFSTNNVNSLTERFRIPNADQVYAMADGSASAPFYSWGSDIDNGMYRITTNTIGLSTDGTERMRFSASEAVINDGSNNYDFRVESDNEANVFFVDASSDRVGFSVAAPTYPIHGEVSDASYGMRIENSNASGVTIGGRNTAAAGTGGGDGVLGLTAQSAGFGLYGVNTNTSGTGIYVYGQGAAGSYLTAGSGGSISGSTIGLWSRATGSNSVGIIGSADGQGAFSLVGESQGGAFTGSDIGVYGFANSNFNGDGGGYFANSGSSYAYVGYRTGGTNYKIIGPGTVSTIVKDTKERDIVMFSPESPEILFQDYGVGKMSNGKCHIDLDENFAKNITVNEKHPLRVFIQLKGDCNGVYVSNENGKGFDVKELMNGNSNSEFYWSVTANRKDEIHSEDGEKTNYEDVRFPLGPGKLKVEEQKSVEGPSEK